MFVNVHLLVIFYYVSLTPLCDIILHLFLLFLIILLFVSFNTDTDPTPTLLDTEAHPELAMCKPDTSAGDLPTDTEISESKKSLKVSTRKV